MKNEDSKSMTGEMKFLIILLVLVATILVGSSLAWFKVTGQSNNNIALDAGNLDVTVDTTSDKILENATPVTRTDALKEDGFKFTVNNKGTLPINYSVNLVDGGLASGETKLDDKYVRCILYKAGNALADDYVSNFAKGKLFDDTLDSGAKNDYELKCYLDNDKYDANAKGKTFKKVISIKAVQRDS